jgi:hypothetical protein
LERAKFFRWLSSRITKPVLPNDEPFDYLATQVVADFLATKADPSLDGILYPSVQGSPGKLNVVLFHEAAKVQSLDIPKGIEILAFRSNITGDGFGIDYLVREDVPSKSHSTAEEPIGFSGALNALEFCDNDEREPTLKLDVSSLEVHHVNSIRFQTDVYLVERFRANK